MEIKMHTMIGKTFVSVRYKVAITISYDNRKSHYEMV